MGFLQVNTIALVLNCYSLVTSLLIGPGGVGNRDRQFGSLVSPSWEERTRKNCRKTMLSLSRPRSGFADARWKNRRAVIGPPRDCQQRCSLGLRWAELPAHIPRTAQRTCGMSSKRHKERRLELKCCLSFGPHAAEDEERDSAASLRSSTPTGRASWGSTAPLNSCADIVVAYMDLIFCQSQECCHYGQRPM